MIRVVYDGPPEAGKTTNVRRLGEMLSLQRRGTVASPGTAGRRTEFFDWLDFAGGFLDGRRLRCQLLTVPGQPSLLRRRRYLLETADAVIFVADSHPFLVEENREAIASLEGTLARIADAPASIVLQANKQDRPNALPPGELATRMQVPPGVPVLGARAEVGEGVKEAFLLAVGLAADRVRALALRNAIGAGADEAGESADELHELLIAHERDAEPPMMIVAPVIEAASAVSPPDSSRIPAGCVWPPMTGRAVCASVAVTTRTARPARRAWAPGDAIELSAERALLLHTRPTWRWPSLDTARVALLAEVRAALPFRELLPADRAVVLGPEGEGWRLWVISPDLPTLLDELDATPAPDAGAIAERWADAWRTLYATLGAHAEPLRPEHVARTARGWALLAFGEAADRPAPAPLPAHLSSTLLARLERVAAWPALWMRPESPL